MRKLAPQMGLLPGGLAPVCSGGSLGVSRYCSWPHLFTQIDLSSPPGLSGLFSPARPDSQMCFDQTCLLMHVGGLHLTDHPGMSELIRLICSLTQTGCVPGRLWQSSPFWSWLPSKRDCEYNPPPTSSLTSGGAPHRGLSGIAWLLTPADPCCRPGSLPLLEPHLATWEPQPLPGCRKRGSWTGRSSPGK